MSGRTGIKHRVWTLWASQFYSAYPTGRFEGLVKAPAFLLSILTYSYPPQRAVVILCYTRESTQMCTVRLAALEMSTLTIRVVAGLSPGPDLWVATWGHP